MTKVHLRFIYVLQSTYLCALTVYKVVYLSRLVSVSDKQPFQVDSKNVKERIFVFAFVLSRFRLRTQQQNEIFFEQPNKKRNIFLNYRR